jgi:hypothetical protein
VQVIDDDLGRSGSRKVERPGDHSRKCGHALVVSGRSG